MDEYKEPSYKNMTITQVIDRLSDIADSAQYCEIEGILCRAIAMLKDYRSIDEFINEPMGGGYYGVLSRYYFLCRRVSGLS